jgi:cell division protein FtsB
MAKVKRLILPILLGLAVYYALFGGEYSLLELRQARSEIAAQEEELNLIRGENEYLRARADSLQNDSATLEKLARERFGMIRDGEILYFTEPKDTAADTLQ